jgi:hypothetical protein
MASTATFAGTPKFKGTLSLAGGGDSALQRIKVALPFFSHLLFALALIVSGRNDRHGFVDLDQYKGPNPNAAIVEIPLRSIEI